MPASRIFCLARTSRWPLASSLTRKARATCTGVSPQTVRNVSATSTSAAKEGWQQVKISRNMSSSSAKSLSSWEDTALSKASCVSAASLSRKEICRRMRSIALLRATLTSQARGLDGGSAAGQCSSATAKASCRTSSARSKSPTRRISVASALPASSRKIFSISLDCIFCRHCGCLIPVSSFERSGMRASPLVVVDHDRPNLDRTGLGAGNSRRDANRGVEILGLDQIITTELFARFGKWAIGREDLAIAYAHGCCGRRRLQSVARLEVAALDDGLGERTIVRHHLLAVRLAQFAEFRFASIDRQQVLHRFTPCDRHHCRHPVEGDDRRTTSSG